MLLCRAGVLPLFLLPDDLKAFPPVSTLTFCTALFMFPRLGVRMLPGFYSLIGMLGGLSYDVTLTFISSEAIPNPAFS